MISRALPALLLLSACTPQNAVLVGGDYFGFISENTSFSLQKESIDPYDWGDDMWTIDCRTFADGKEKRALQLTGIDPECEDNDKRPQCQDRRLKKLCDDWVEVPQTEPVRYRPEHETWMGQSPWWVVHENLEPWRGEAVITAEGDIQIGFHHRLPGGSDFRFAFVIDPDFAPKQCDIESGEAVPRDGDWLANWSASTARQIDGVPGLEHLAKYANAAELDQRGETGAVFFLNSGGFQFNPDNTLDYWFLPEQWEAGYGGGKYSEENFQTRAPRWGINEVYEYFEVYDPGEGYGVEPRASDLFFCELAEGEDPLDNTCFQNLLAELDDEIMPSIRDTYNKALKPAFRDFDAQKEWSPDWSPVYHDNTWRPADGRKAGFDGWAELHYNVVAFDKTPAEMAKLEAGDSFKGAFTIVYDGLDSNSRFLVRGEFEVPKLKQDRWTTVDLRALKLEENGNTLCVLE